MNKDELIGTRIREYEIIESIGKGGMGSVYKARHVLLQKERAIKVIQSFLAGQQDHRDRFVREARILSELNHPNLVRLYEFGMLDENTLFMVMEFVQGESALKRMKRIGKIPTEESIRIICQAAQGLHSAHTKGIIHRDISPDNLMLVKDESGYEITKVIDFGIAKPLAGEAKQYTATDMFLGKPEYCSPEQTGILEEGSSIDHRSDIYSLAVTLYYMLVGKLPFFSPTPMGYLVKHATEPPRPMVSFSLPGIPESLDRVILKALSKNRNERPSSMLEFANDLERVFQSEVPRAHAAPIPVDQVPTIATHPTVALTVVQEPAREKKSKMAIWIAVGLIGVIAVAGFVRILTKKDSKAEPQTVRQVIRDFTPAIASSDIEAVNALIQQGADVNASGPSGETPLLQAAMINNAGVLQVLLDAGANVNMGDRDGLTPLMKSAYWGFKENVEALLRAGADVNAMNDSGITPLMQSSYWGYQENVEALIQAKAGVNIASPMNGENALMKAAEGGRVEILPILIQAGANVHAKDKSEATALQRAGQYGDAGKREAMVAILQKAGAKD